MAENKLTSISILPKSVLIFGEIQYYKIRMQFLEQLEELM